jgi:uncharacterized small protein (DUF1192 family)
MAMADLSPRGTQHRKDGGGVGGGGDWWREELVKKRSMTEAPAPMAREGGEAEGQPGESGTVAESLLTSEERALRAREVEEYNKKLEEDKKNRRHRVLDLLSAELEQMTTAAETDTAADVTPAAEPTAEDGSVEAKPVLHEAGADNVSGVVSLRSLVGSPRGKESGEAPPLVPLTDPAAPEESAGQDLELMQSGRGGGEIVSEIRGGGGGAGEQERRPDEDVVEIEITRQDPRPTADGKGTLLVETKKMTIQIIVKRRDAPASAPLVVPTLKAIAALKEEGTDPASQSDGATSDGEEELFFSQENEAVVVSFRRGESVEEEDEGEGGEAAGDYSAGGTLESVQKELEEKMKAMASLQREIERLKARRKGFIRAARRTGERKSSECL